MKKNFSLKQEDYERFKLFEHQIFRIENITAMTISDFEILYFNSYDTVTDVNLDQFIDTELRILVPNKNSIDGKRQYKNIHFITYQDSYEHYDLIINYKYLSKEQITEMKRVYQ